MVRAVLEGKDVITVTLLEEQPNALIQERSGCKKRSCSKATSYMTN